MIEKPKTSGRIKTTIDTTGFFFKDQARRGRGRTPGGSGSSRGTGRRSGEGEERRPGRGEDRRGRGEDRRGRGEKRSFGGGGGGRRRDFAPNVEDEKDFPSLGAQ